MSGSNPTRRKEQGSSALGAESELAEADYGDCGDCADEPAWCVEHGSTLFAMTTGELIAAVAAGHISAAARVWAEGLECWTRIYDVPELAAQLYGVDADLATPPAVEIASRGSSSHGQQAWQGLTPVEAPFAAGGLSMTSVGRSEPPRPSDGAPIPVARSVRDDIAANAKRRRLARAMGGGDARWIAGGLAIAAAAIGIALLQAPSSPEPPLARAEHRLGLVQEAARAAAAGVRASAKEATISRTEPGQRRQRGGTGRLRRP